MINSKHCNVPCAIISLVWLAEGEPPHRHALRQTREKLCADGFVGLCYAVFTTLLFVYSLDTTTEK